MTEQGKSDMLAEAEAMSRILAKAKTQGDVTFVLCFMLDEIERHTWEQAAKIEQLKKALAFFRSVILSGEEWTDRCEQTFRAAMDGESNNTSWGRGEQK